VSAASIVPRLWVMTMLPRLAALGRRDRGDFASDPRRQGAAV